MRPDLIRLADALLDEGRPFAIATVVRREPPTSAQLGDSALVTADGELHGWLGGVCTRETIVREARAALAAGRPRLVALSPDPDAERRPGVRTLPMTCHSGGGVEIYVEPQVVPDRLIVFGATETALSLTRLAKVLGLRVEVVDPAADAALVPEADAVHPDPGSLVAVPPKRRPGSRLFAVVATYGEWDGDALRAALALEPDLVALVAGPTRFEALRETLVARGVPAEDADRVESPAGLDIGARAPGEIAVSILARLVQARRAAERRDAADERRAVDAEDAAAKGEGAATVGETESSEGAGGHEAPAGGGRPRRPSPGDEESAIDPVCGMTVTPGRAPSVEHQGRLVHFCCDGCRERFLAEPEAYSVPL